MSNLILKILAFIYRKTGRSLFSDYVDRQFDKDHKDIKFIDDISRCVARGEWDYKKGFYLTSDQFLKKMKKFKKKHDIR